MADLPLLPVRILRMIRELHQRGYQSLYLYAGMSPSGTHWRFNIGIVDDSNLWPGNYSLINTSIGRDVKPEWSELDASVSKLADDFEIYYAHHLVNARKARPDFVTWFDQLVETIGDNLLVFSADYDAPHKYLLDSAPYYCY